MNIFSGFRSYALQTYLTFYSFYWIFEIKAILNLFPEQVQNFDIFRTRDISRTLSIYSVKIHHINPSRPNPGRREKKKLIFYFHTSLWCLKRFSEGLKGLNKIF